MSSAPLVFTRLAPTGPRVLATLLLLGALPASPGFARGADSPPPPSPHALQAGAGSEAERNTLYREGTQLATLGRWSEAVEQFRKAAAIRESPRVLFTLGQAEERAGHKASAKKSYERAAALANAAADRDAATAAQQALVLVAPHVAQLRWSTHENVRDLSVRVDGATVTGSSLELDAGPHRLEASAEGKPFYAIDVHVEDGQVCVVPISPPHVPSGTPEERPSAPPAPTIPTAPGTPKPTAPTDNAIRSTLPDLVKSPPPASPDRTWVGALLLGTGIVSGALGAGAIGLSFDDVAEADRAFAEGKRSVHEAAVDRANTKQWAGGIAVGTGVVAMGIGLFVLLSSPSKAQGARASQATNPLVFRW